MRDLRCESVVQQKGATTDFRQRRTLELAGTLKNAVEPDAAILVFG